MWSTLHEETAQLVKNLDIIDPQIKEVHFIFINLLFILIFENLKF